MSPAQEPPPQSPRQQAFLGELTRLAPSQASVLIRGEHGAGKSRAASMLHRYGDRSTGPLVVVDLGALAPSLMEAELFGHEAGAFTGAQNSRLGRVRRAEGGTLVLDGLEGLALPAQGKLLRVLQEREVEPLGSERPIAVDVRVVATAGPGLEAAIEGGAFRQDLYYRLAVVEIEAPPLRARLEDLPDLIDSLSKEMSRRTSLPARAFSAPALGALTDHPWPGNVRELENAIERVLVLGPRGGELVEPEELEFLGESVEGAGKRVAQEALAHGVSLDELDRLLMQAALEQARGNLSAAARAIGVSRKAFKYRFDKLEDGER